MNEFKIGDIVQMTGNVMTGNVGTVVSVDDSRGLYLVRIDGATQNYFAATDLKTFTA
ncbi:hypothetical protein [Streptomyces sp. AC495_CC817]|uniref:hypothetical protein n=1 Tax=Streptomyces sp. AC495_CC817 TaxID=2823900 RepID=UPI001C274BD5|nr:hypothetical protein [Streptomyces sp. AC495_CC817]